jgi:hypothetical protein
MGVIREMGVIRQEGMIIEEDAIGGKSMMSQEEVEVIN